MGGWAMTPEAQRIAIAEACGWSYEKNETYAPDGAFWWSKNPEFPDYLNDLNAMHEAENTLTYEQLNEYGCYLVTEHYIENGGSIPDICIGKCAPARLRARCFIMLITNGFIKPTGQKQ